MLVNTAETGSIPKKPPAPGLILVIDDEEILRSAIAEILEMKGFEVLTAENGKAGLALFRQHAAAISLVLLDIAMPVMTGDAAFRALRRLRGDVPVILLSGYDESETVQRIGQSDNSCFLRKPFKLEALLAKIEEVLAGTKDTFTGNI